MPKQTPSIPNDILWARLGDRSALSDELWLIAAQVGMLLGRSTDQLAEDRKVGNPPPFKKDGGSIRYRLGSVRDHMFGSPEFNNTTQARLADKKRFAICRDFSAWESLAAPSSLWPFLLRPGHTPCDFWQSLTLGAELSDSDTCALLRPDDYRDLYFDPSLGRNIAPPPDAADENKRDWDDGPLLSCDAYDQFVLRVKSIATNISGFTPTQSADPSFEVITSTAGLDWIRNIVDRHSNVRHDASIVAQMSVLNATITYKSALWTIEQGIPILMNCSLILAASGERPRQREIDHYTQQANYAAIAKDLKANLSSTGQWIVTATELLGWAVRSGVPIDPAVAREIKYGLGCIKPKPKGWQAKAGETAKRNLTLRNLAKELRDKHPNWTKVDIAEKIAQTTQYGLSVSRIQQIINQVIDKSS